MTFATLSLGCYPQPTTQFGSLLYAATYLDHSNLHSTFPFHFKIPILVLQMVFLWAQEREFCSFCYLRVQGSYAQTTWIVIGKTDHLILPLAMQGSLINVSCLCHCQFACPFHAHPSFQEHFSLLTQQAPCTAWWRVLMSDLHFMFICILENIIFSNLSQQVMCTTWRKVLLPNLIHSCSFVVGENFHSHRHHTMPDRNSCNKAAPHRSFGCFTTDIQLTPSGQHQYYIRALIAWMQTTQMPPYTHYHIGALPTYCRISNWLLCAYHQYWSINYLL